MVASTAKCGTDAAGTRSTNRLSVTPGSTASDITHVVLVEEAGQRQLLVQQAQGVAGGGVVVEGAAGRSRGAAAGARAAARWRAPARRGASAAARRSSSTSTTPTSPWSTGAAVPRGRWSSVVSPISNHTVLPDPGVDLDVPHVDVVGEQVQAAPGAGGGGPGAGHGPVRAGVVDLDAHQAGVAAHPQVHVAAGVHHGVGDQLGDGQLGGLGQMRRPGLLEQRDVRGDAPPGRCAARRAAPAARSARTSTRASPPRAPRAARCRPGIVTSGRPADSGSPAARGGVTRRRRTSVVAWVVAWVVVRVVGPGRAMARPGRTRARPEPDTTRTTTETTTGPRPGRHTARMPSPQPSNRPAPTSGGGR